jgi:ABC-type Fe3+-hydroxamate transport system substrate-binding protein
VTERSVLLKADDLALLGEIFGEATEAQQRAEAALAKVRARLAEAAEVIAEHRKNLQ